MHDFTVIVPAYNEFESLKIRLTQWHEAAVKNNFLLIIVNDGSTDQSKSFLDHESSTKKNLQIIHHNINRGYGATLKTGIRNTETQYAVTMDADGQHQIEDCIKLVKLLEAKDADLAIGKRPLSYQDLYRTLGKKLIRFFVSILFPRFPIKDLNSGMKAMKVDIAKKLIRACPDQMAFSDIFTLIFYYKRYYLIEEPIEIKPRQHGGSTISTMTAFETVWQIALMVMMFNPMRVFLPLSLLLVITGTGWSISFLLKGGGVTIASSIVIFAGLLCFALGLIAEQISILINRDL